MFWEKKLRLSCILGVAMCAVDPLTAQGQQSMADMNDAGMFLMGLASGTSANPASWPMPMPMTQFGNWNAMFMGTAFVSDIQQSGPRGGDKLYSTNWFMASAEHSAGDNPERAGEIAKLGGEHGADQRSGAGDGGEVVSEDDPLIGGNEVAAVVETFGGSSAQRIERQHFRRNKTAVETIADSVGRHGSHDQPEGIDLFAAMQGDGGQRKRTQQADGNPEKNAEEFWHESIPGRVLWRKRRRIASGNARHGRVEGLGRGTMSGNADFWFLQTTVLRNSCMIIWCFWFIKMRSERASAQRADSCSSQKSDWERQ